MGRLFWKFFFASWLSLLAAGAGVGMAVWWRHQLLEQARLGSETLIIDRHAGLFVSSAAEVLQYRGSDGLKEFLQQLRSQPFPQVYAIDDQGREIADHYLSPELLSQVRDWHEQLGNTEAVRKVSTADGRQYLLFVLLPKQSRREGEPEESPSLAPPMFTEGEPSSLPPDFFRHVPTPHPSNEHRPEQPLWVPVVSGTLASLLLSAILAWYFAKPIRSLRNAFAAAADGKLDVRVAETMGRRHDELADLGRDFDHMAAQLDSLISAQQRLLNDVSHELRSPLARMQAAIGLAQQQPDKIPETLERVERESQRISDLVGELLVLSRLEAGVGDDETTDTDLGGLLADIVEDARFEAEQKQVTIRYRGFEDVIVKTRCELLYRAVENVVRNAVEHCRPDGEVGIAAEFDNAEQRLRIGIDDQGPGVAESDLQAIFQPFFRSGVQKRPNSVGLGLTIAYRAIETLGGNITARNRREGGLHIDINVPFPRA